MGDRKIVDSWRNSNCKMKIPFLFFDPVYIYCFIGFQTCIGFIQLQPSERCMDEPLRALAQPRAVSTASRVDTQIFIKLGKLPLRKSLARGSNRPSNGPSVCN